MKTESNTGHIAAVITIIIWASTFVSTKLLLREFSPIEILLFRFTIGYLALLLISPKKIKITDRRHERYFALAGLTGICMYYLLENIALTYTQASNVGVIISVAPFFTAMISRTILKDENKPNMRFFAGFIMAMTGIMLISFKGFDVQMNAKGDLLALLAAFTWACYSVLSKKISEFGYHSIQVTRKTFGYGILFMIPAMFVSDFNLDLERFNNSVNLINILFLGLGASALCFVSWNYAVKVLGAVKTSIYIYLVPVITVLVSSAILNEVITGKIITGIVLTVIGLFVSEKRFLRKAVLNYE